MRIGALSTQTGVSRDTIRFYERHGLIASFPSQSFANSYRDYPSDLVERLAMIVEAREAGMSVADLQLLIHHLEEGGDETFDVEGFLDTKISEVEQTIARSRKFLKVLRATRSALEDTPEEWL